MSLTEEYAKKLKYPIKKVTITRFDRGEAPGVESEGTDHEPQLISCDIDFNFGQSAATCTLEILSPINEETGEYVTFKAMDRVVVKQGYNVGGTLTPTFVGFVDSTTFVNPPRTQILRCRDVLKLALNKYYIEADKKVYSASTHSAAERQAEAIVSDFLCESGIPSGFQQLDISHITIASYEDAEFVYEYAMDAINRICDLIRFRVWADPTGVVRFRYISEYAAANAALSYRSAEVVFSGAWWDTHEDEEGVFVELQQGNLLNVIEASIDDEDLRNWVTVVSSYDENLATTIYGDSDYVPDPPRFRKAEVRSYGYDTQELIDWAASVMYSGLNRLQYSAEVEIEGDPRVKIAQTIEIIDEWTTGSGIKYFLYGYSSRHDSHGYVQSLQLVGGAGEGAPPAANQSPVAMFTYQVARETLNGVDWYLVSVDGSPSYDLDGNLSIPSGYMWTVSGFALRYGIHQLYAVSDDPLAITLTVTDDGSPPLSDEITHNIDFTRGDTKVRAIYLASGNTVQSTTSGGKAWKSRTLY
jgi:hypothetical protein